MTNPAAMPTDAQAKYLRALDANASATGKATKATMLVCWASGWIASDPGHMWHDKVTDAGRDALARWEARGL